MVKSPKKSGGAQHSSIPSWASAYLNEDDAQAIENAIAEAEKKTSGEIVPVIVKSSVALRPPSLIISAIFALIFVVVISRVVGDWFDYREIVLMVFGFAMAAVLGRVVARNALIRRALQHDHDAAKLALHRAELEFYRSGIGKTKDNTGILLYLSVEDREAVVLADKSISDLLPPETWNEVLLLMVDGLKKGRCAEGITKAISKCGDILATHFPIKSDDTNELINHLIIKE
jgi:putative membrane protein